MGALPLPPLTGDRLACPDCDGYTEAGRLRHADTCPVTQALKEISRRDREWFTAHPGAKAYRRELMPGDIGVPTLEGVVLGTLDDRPPRVVVRQVADGIRVRSLPPGLVLDPSSMWGVLAACTMAALPSVPARWWE